MAFPREIVWRPRGRVIVFPRRPLVMGIVNVNDDSFSGDGTLDPQAALAIAASHLRNGADLIDFGAESARTNRAAIPVEDELARFRGVLVHWQQLVLSTIPADADQLWPPLLSINTWRAEVISALLAEFPGIHLVNDMSGLPEPGNAAVCASLEASLLIMHSVGEPKIPHFQQQWPDIVAELDEFFAAKIALARTAGLPPDAIVIDPGLDFAKQRDDNLRVLAALGALARHQCPVLLPVSRKTVIGEVLDRHDPIDRDAGTIALIAVAIRRLPALIFRVHNVAAAWQACKILYPLESPEPELVSPLP